MAQKWWRWVLSIASWLVGPERLAGLMGFVGGGLGAAIAGLPPVIIALIALAALTLALASTHYILLFKERHIRRAESAEIARAVRQVYRPLKAELQMTLSRFEEEAREEEGFLSWELGHEVLPEAAWQKYREVCEGSSPVVLYEKVRDAYALIGKLNRHAANRRQEWRNEMNLLSQGDGLRELPGTLQAAINALSDALKPYELDAAQ